MHYPASTSSSQNKGSSSSAWSYYTSSSNVSLPRTPTIGFANLPPSPATSSNNFNGGGAQPMAPYMGAVSLPPSEPGTPRYHTGTRQFLRVKTRRMLMPETRYSNSPREPEQHIGADVFCSGLTPNPRTQPCAMDLFQCYPSSTRTCCTSKLYPCDT